jgi:hypothetical protein
MRLLAERPLRRIVRQSTTAIVSGKVLRAIRLNLNVVLVVTLK